jgi:hypothetical protein
VKASPLHACNVFQVGAPNGRLWQFSVSGHNAVLDAELGVPPGSPVPKRATAKSWQTLWKRKLNVAWLPADQVFLRVVQLPASDPKEIQAMVELQLEKLSPLPVGQIVWSFEIVPADLAASVQVPAPPPPSAGDGPAKGEAEAAPESTVPLQTVVVLIAARNQVETFLGALEGQGYLADRLEFSLLHQFLITPVTGDGAWIYPDREGETQTALVAWWYGGVLQNLTLLQLPAGETWAAALQEHLTQMTWAGELDGWLTALPQWHLVAEPTLAAAWEPALNRLLSSKLAVSPALSTAERAALNVQHIAGSGSRANLLPTEYSNRYRQQFIDRLWMGGLGALVLIYLIGIGIYFAGVKFAEFQKGRVDAKVAGVKIDYQLALQLKEKAQVLNQQARLKFAALDCWRSVAENLPEGVMLTSLTFERGRRLILFGETDQFQKLTDFNESLSKARFSGSNEKLFVTVDIPKSQTVAGGRQTWSFGCELNFPEIQ